MSASDQSEVCPTVTVEDVPTDRDRFGPHRQLARTLVDLISKEGGGRLIGLCGRWGSGKSTVLKLLSAELLENKSTSIWTFDAWAHEGDPLRRTFLESLIQHLVGAGWVDAEFWKGKRAELTGKKKVVTQQSHPRLTTFGTLATISLFLVPFGVTLFQNALVREVRFFEWGVPVDWRAAVGFGLMGAPLIVAGLWILWSEIERLARTPPLPTRSYGSLLAPIVKQTDLDTVTESFESTEPTSLEFENLFRELVAAALKKPDHKLILAIDNLDRVETEAALRIWSTLQTFINRPGVRPEWLERLWVIIPFDNQGLRKLWEGRNSNAPGEIAQSFLDKSFSLTFEVPVALVSEWNEYLFELLSQALPAHDKSSLQEICRLFSAVRTASADAPTPRELKLFANQLGVLHRQRQHEVRLLHQAYYVLAARKQQNIPADLVAGIIPRPEEDALLGDGVKDSLAAIHFCAPVELARQLLLNGPIAAALRDGDAAALTKALRGSEKSRTVLAEVVSRSIPSWGKAESGLVFLAAAALKDANLFQDPTETDTALTITQFTEVCKRMTRMRPLSVRAAEGAAAICTLANDQAIADQIWTIAQSTLSEEVEQNQLGVGNAAQIAETLAAGLEAQFPKVISKGMALPVDAATFVSLFSRKQPSDPGPQLRSHLFRMQKVPESIVPFCQQLTNEGRFRAEHLAAIRTAVRNSSVKGWGPFAEAARQRLNASNNPPPEEWEPLLASLTFLGSDKTVWNHAIALVQEGHIASYVWAGNEAKNWKAVARAMHTYMYVVPTLDPQNQIANSPAGYQLINGWLAKPPSEVVLPLADLIATTSGEKQLMKLADRGGGPSSLAGMLLTQLTRTPAAKRIFAAADVLKHWGLIEAGGPLDQAVLIAADSGALPSLIKQGDFLPEHALLYDALCRVTPTDLEFRQWVAAAIGSLPMETWEREVWGGGAVVKLAQGLNGLGQGVSVGFPLRDALMRTAKRALAGEVPPEGLPTRVRDAVGLLDSNEAGALPVPLYDEVLENVARINDLFVSTFGDIVAQSTVVGDDKYSVARLVEPLLVTQHIVGLRWVAEALRRNATMFKAATPESMQSFKARLSVGLRDTPEGDAKAAMADLATQLGVVAAAPDEPEAKGG